MTALADVLGGERSVLRTGVVAQLLSDDRYRLTDSLGRCYEVRSAAALALGAQVLHQDGVVVKQVGTARPAKIYEV
jgi:hypothetical protein